MKENIDNLERITDFDICAGLWRGRSVSAYSTQAKQRIYYTNETFRLFLQRQNAYNLSKKTLDENKKNNKLVRDNILMKVDDIECLYLVNTCSSVNKL